MILTDCTIEVSKFSLPLRRTNYAPRVTREGQEAAEFVDSVSSGVKDGEHRAELEAEVERIRTLAHEDGYWTGFRQGEEAGQEKWEIHAKLAQAAASAFVHAAEHARAGVEDEIIEIAFAAICKMIGTSGASRESLAYIVKMTVSRLSIERPTTVRVHPDDVMMMRELVNAEFAGAAIPISVIGDQTIAIGGCRIESVEGNLDARLENQLTELKRVMVDARHRSERG